MRFQIDRDSQIALYTQLVEQIRYAIATGELAGGQRLPSIRELSQRLGVNVNTINKAYQQLQEQGLVVTHGPKGAFVASLPPQELQPGPPLDGVSIVTVFDTAIREAMQLGYDLPAIERVFQERLEIAHALRNLPVVAFVECSQTEADDHVQELREQIRADFQPVVLSDLADQPDQLQSADLVVTTLFHLGQVKDLVGSSSEVVGVVVNLQVEALQQLSSFPQGTQMIVVCRDAVTMATLEQSLHDICPQGIQISPHVLGEPSALEAAIAQGDVVVYTPPCRHAVQRIIPAGTPHVEHRSRIDANSVEFLRQKIAALSPQ